jgi:predicted  nucleic acid-binding Zn-ribbon protein
MQNLINKFSGIVGEAAQLVSDYKKRHSDLDQREKKLISDKAGVDALLAEISKRESAIVPTENVRNLEKEVEEKSQKISQMKAELEHEKQSFKTYSDSMRQQYSEKEKELVEIQKNIDIGKKKIQEEIDKGIKEFVSKFKT